MGGIFRGIQNIINNIRSIVEFFKTLANFITNLFKALLELIRLLANIVTNGIALIGTLPPWLTAFAMATLSVAVLYMIIGRESGKNE